MISNGNEPEREDPGLSIFGCDFLKELNYYVKLPNYFDERTLFTGGHQQQTPLELRDKVFKENLITLIKEMNEKIRNLRIVRP